MLLPAFDNPWRMAGDSAHSKPVSSAGKKNSLIDVTIYNFTGNQYRKA